MPKKRSSRRLIMRSLVVILILIISAYLVLDSQVIKNNINLPFHVFGSSKQSDTNSTSSSVSSAPTLPAGFSKYNLSGTNVTFAAPTSWGVPAVATDDGFTKRGGSNNASDGKYAYLTAFPNNQEVTMVFSSGRYLPPARAPVYYDFLQWCVGTNDGNYYQSAMRFTTSGGVDSPATIACDQPLTNVTKIDATTIVQKAAKTTDGKDFGDLYTKNLSDKSIPVVRVRDSTMKNADNITSILNNITFSSSAQ